MTSITVASEEFEALFHETVWPLLNEREYLWGSFVWNMFDFASPERDDLDLLVVKNCCAIIFC